jgi:hypothetical protein
MNQFPPSPRYPFTTLSNFFENSWRYLQVKVHHQFQRHQWQISTTPAANFDTSFDSVVDNGNKFAISVNNTGGKFAVGVNDTSGKFATSINVTSSKFSHQSESQQLTNSQVGELAFESLKENLANRRVVDSPTRQVGESSIP